MKKFFLVSIAIFLLYSLAFGEDSNKRGVIRFKGEMRFYPFNIPNLTKDQIEKLAALQSKFIIAVAQINSDLIVKRFEYKEMILQDIADKEKLKAKEKEIINLQLALYENILQFNFELRNILTPEQFKLWRTKSTKIPFPKEKNR